MRIFVARQRSQLHGHGERVDLSGSVRDLPVHRSERVREAFRSRPRLSRQTVRGTDHFIFEIIPPQRSQIPMGTAVCPKCHALFGQPGKTRPVRDLESRCPWPFRSIPDVASADVIRRNEQSYRQTLGSEQRPGDLREVLEGVIESDRHGIGVDRKRE